MKTIKSITGMVVLSSSLLVTSAQAAVNLSGSYIGAHLGYGWSNLNDKNISKSAVSELLPGRTDNFSSSSNTHGVGGRLFSGYMVNDLVGIEVGYSIYSKSSSSAKIVRRNRRVELDATNKVTAVDLLGVYRLPVRSINNVTLNLKAGVAYVMNVYSVDVDVNSAGPEPLDRQRSNNFRPKFAVGADYALTDAINFGVTYELTTGRGTPYNLDGVGNSNYSPRLQLFTAGFSYGF